MESKAQNTVLTVTSDCDLSDVIVGVIRNHRGTKGCTIKEIHRFVQADYTVEIADDYDFYRHLIVSCKKLIKNGRLFKHGCKYRVSYSKLCGDKLSDSSSPVKDVSMQEPSVYVCELCKENDEGKKDSEISVSVAGDCGHGKSNLPAKCSLCHSCSSCTAGNDESSFNLSLPNHSINCDRDIMMKAFDSTASVINDSISVSFSSLNDVASEKSLVSGDTHSAILDGVRPSNSMTDHPSFIGDSDLQSNGKSGDSLKSSSTASNVFVDGSEQKQAEAKIHRTKNRRTQVKFLTDGLTQFYSSEGKRKRPSNVANSGSSVSPKAKKLRTGVEDERSKDELNCGRQKRPEKRYALTSSDAKTDVKRSKKKAIVSTESHGTYQLLVGIKEDILFPHITEEDVKMFENARSVAMQRLQQKLSKMYILPSAVDSTSTNSAFYNNWTPAILLPLDCEDDASSKCLVDGVNTVLNCHQPVNKNVDLLDRSASSNKCKNDDNENSFSECDDAGDHEFSDDDNSESKEPVGSERNIFPDTEPNGDAPCSSAVAEDTSTCAGDIMVNSSQLDHHHNEVFENGTVESVNDDTADDNSAIANETKGVISFGNESVELLSNNSLTVEKITSDEMNTVGTDVMDVVGLSASSTDETDVINSCEDTEDMCLNASAHGDNEDAVKNAASSDDAGFVNADMSLAKGINAAFFNTSVADDVGIMDKTSFVNEGTEVLCINESGVEIPLENKEEKMATDDAGETSSSFLDRCLGNDESEALQRAVASEIVSDDLSGRATGELVNDDGDGNNGSSESTVDDSAGKDWLNVGVTVNSRDECSVFPLLASCSAVDIHGYVSSNSDDVGELMAVESTELIATEPVSSDDGSFPKPEAVPEEVSGALNQQTVEKEMNTEPDMHQFASTEESVVSPLCACSELGKSDVGENLVAASNQAAVEFCGSSDSAEAISITRDQAKVGMPPNEDEVETEVCSFASATEQLSLSSGPCVDGFMEDLISSEENLHENHFADQTCIKNAVSLYLDQDERQDQERNCSEITFSSVDIMQCRDEIKNHISSYPDPPNAAHPEASDKAEDLKEQIADGTLPSKRNRKRKRMFCPDGCCSDDSSGHCKALKTDETSPKIKSGNDTKQKPSSQQSEFPRRRGRPKKNKGNEACSLETSEASVMLNAEVSNYSVATDLGSTSALEAAVAVVSKSVTDTPTRSYATIASDALVALGPLVSHQMSSIHEVIYPKEAVTKTGDSVEMDASCEVFVDNAHFLTIKTSADRETVKCTPTFSNSESFIPSEMSVSAAAVTCNETLSVNIPASASTQTLVSPEEECVLGEMVPNFDPLSSIKESNCSRNDSLFGNVLLDQWNGLEETVVNDRTTGFCAASRGLEAEHVVSLAEEENAALLNSSVEDVTLYKSHEENVVCVTSVENNSWITSNELTASECSVSGRDIVSALADVLSSHATKLDSAVSSKTNVSCGIELPQTTSAVHLRHCGSLSNVQSSGVCNGCLVAPGPEPQNPIIHFSGLPSTLEQKSQIQRPEYNAVAAKRSAQVELLDKNELLGLMKLNNLLPNEPEKNDFAATTKSHDYHVAALNAVTDFNATKLGIGESISSDSCQLPSSTSLIQECCMPYNSLSADCQVQIPTEFQLQSENQIRVTVLPSDGHIQMPSDSSQMLLQLVNPNMRDCQVPLHNLNSEVYVATSCHQLPSTAYVGGVSNMQNGNFANNNSPAVQNQSQMDTASFLGTSCINAGPTSTATNASSGSIANGIQESLLHVQPSNFLYALPLQSAVLVNGLGRLFSTDASLVNVPQNVMYALPVQSVVAGVSFDTAETAETANKNLCNKPNNPNPGMTGQCPMHSYGGRTLMPQLLGCQPHIIICPGAVPLSSILQPLSESLGQCHPHLCSVGPQHQACHASVMGNLVSPLPQCVWGVSPQNISSQNVIPVAKSSAEANSAGEMFVSTAEHQQQGGSRCNLPQIATLNICSNAYGTQMLNSINASQFVSENLLAQQFVATQNLSVQLGHMTDANTVAFQVQAYSPGK